MSFCVQSKRTLRGQQREQGISGVGNLVFAPFTCSRQVMRLSNCRPKYLMKGYGEIPGEGSGVHVDAIVGYGPFADKSQRNALSLI